MGSKQSAHQHCLLTTALCCLQIFCSYQSACSLKFIHLQTSKTKDPKPDKQNNQMLMHNRGENKRKDSLPGPSCSYLYSLGKHLKEFLSDAFVNVWGGKKSSWVDSYWDIVIFHGNHNHLDDILYFCCSVFTLHYEFMGWKAQGCGFQKLFISGWPV